MNKKYLLIPLAILIIASTAVSAEAFSFRSLLERFHLVRNSSTQPTGRASSTSPWFRGQNRSSTSTMPFFGTISAVNDSSLTIKLDRPNSIPGARGYRASTTISLPDSLTVILDNNTIYASSTKSDLVVGVKISGQAKINTDQSLTAVRIHVNPPRDGSNRPEIDRLHRGSTGGVGKGPRK